MPDVTKGLLKIWLKSCAEDSDERLAVEAAAARQRMADLESGLLKINDLAVGGFGDMDQTELLDAIGRFALDVLGGR